MINEDDNKCKCELDNFLTYTSESLNVNLCVECNTNYYPMENDALNIGDFINCYKEIKGYYLDKDNSIFKKCYESCEICEVEGNNMNHNCLKCKTYFPIEINNNNYANCYEKCDYYHYYDEDNKYHCTFECPDEYPILIEQTSECISFVQTTDKISSVVIKQTNKIIEREKDNEYYNEVIKIFEQKFMSEDYDTSKLDNGEEEIHEIEKMTITFTTVENQKSNENKNITTINLGECEKLLRKHYNISNDKNLYIKKIDIIQEGIKIPKIDYDVYCQLSGKGLEKLNLKICGDKKIFLSLPVSLDNDIDKYNSSSGYYNDICYKTTSESGTDISLKDRKIEFIDENKTVGQENCGFSDYDSKKQKANCSCQVKASSSSNIDININKTKLYENFGDMIIFFVRYIIRHNYNQIICNHLDIMLYLHILLFYLLMKYLFHFQK